MYVINTYLLSDVYFASISSQLVIYIFILLAISFTELNLLRNYSSLGHVLYAVIATLGFQHAWKEGPSIEELLLSHWPMGMSWGIFLTVN